jgi:hypothetical protein
MLDESIISPYIGDQAEKHSFYERSIEIAEALMLHSRGYVPENLFKQFRPNEDVKYLDYRKAVFKAVTKTYYSKVVNTIKKINRAEDWNIQFTDDTEFKKYMVDEYPYFESLENWFFSIALNQMCEDPNSVFAVFPLPKDNPENDTEQYRPYTHVFPSENVVYFKEGRLCILLSEEKSEVIVNNKREWSGNIYYCIDKDSFMEVVQTGKKEDNIYEYAPAISHNCKKMPAVKSGGIIESFSNGDCLFDSFIGDALPFWDEAINRYSDHQVNMAIHLHPREWEMLDSPCRANGCKGGKVVEFIDGKEHKSDCRTCQGTGMVSTKSPFDVKFIKPAFVTGADGSTPVPTPPMGIVERDIASISFLKQEFKDNIKYGLSALNMEFLMDEPEVNSGVAKSLDRQEFNTFIFTIARHIVNNLLNPLYRFHACWMYPNKEDIITILPSIAVPSKFDILSSDLVSARLESAKNAGLSATIRGALEIEYADSVFGEESTEALIIKITNLLDPIPYKTEDEKMAILSNQGVSKDSYILSSNLASFINRAVNESETFLSDSYESQIALMKTYVDEIKNIGINNLVSLTDDNGLPMGGDINTPVDIEAEAKARLKGSVGGVQGILQIQASVSQGITGVESAVVLLGEIYGYAPDVARKMLGTPKKQTIPPKQNVNAA